MTVGDAIEMVEKDGWFQVRQSGSHRQFHHPTKKGTVTIAGNVTKMLDHWVVRSIKDQAGLT